MEPLNLFFPLFYFFLIFIPIFIACLLPLLLAPNSVL